MISIERVHIWINNFFAWSLIVNHLHLMQIMEYKFRKSNFAMIIFFNELARGNEVSDWWTFFNASSRIVSRKVFCIGSDLNFKIVLHITNSVCHVTSNRIIPVTKMWLRFIRLFMIPEYSLFVDFFFMKSLSHGEICFLRSYQVHPLIDS